MTGPSRAFVALTRNPDLAPPVRVERTAKRPGDVEIITGKVKEQA